MTGAVHSEAISRELAAVLAERRVPGGGFCAFGLDRPTVTGVAGTRRSSRTDPVQPSDLWHVGSVTKAMTADVILALQDQGLLSLDESVTDGLAGSPWRSMTRHPHWHSVTLRDLLTHRSGMRANPTYALFSRYVVWGEPKKRTNQAAMRQSLNHGIGPAGRYRYSNSAYGVAGAIAAHRSGRSWESLIRDDYKDVHGITSLGFGRPEWFGAHPWGHRRRLVSAGYTDFRITKRGLDLEIMRPAGDVHLSLEGLAQHGLVHLRRMAAGDDDRYDAVGGTTNASRGGGYGLGWHVEDSAAGFGERMVWHNGSDLFSFTLIGLLPDSGVGFAWVTNALQRNWRTSHADVWQPLNQLLPHVRAVP